MPVYNADNQGNEAIQSHDNIHVQDLNWFKLPKTPLKKNQTADETATTQTWIRSNALWDEHDKHKATKINRNKMQDKNNQPQNPEEVKFSLSLYFAKSARFEAYGLQKI